MLTIASTRKYQLLACLYFVVAVDFSMASMVGQAAAAAAPSSSPPRWVRDVYLSFRVDNTHNGFTAHLHEALVKRGIKACMDSNDLNRGKWVEPTIWKAIEESRFSIVVFSKDYASSPWCLEELVKIVACMEDMEHRVFPVFYDVGPIEVGKQQSGSYEKALAQHEQELKENMEKVQTWRRCLHDVANMPGWDARGRNESKVIEEIVLKISFVLRQTSPPFSLRLVGVDSDVIKVVDDYFCKELTDVRMIGICGMGGIGKTTIARVVYDRVGWEFEGTCFLANIRELCEKHGLYHLQEQLLSQILMEEGIKIDNEGIGITEIKSRLQPKKVLLVLDDVENQTQLDFLAGERCWFGPGSRIIITSRDKHLLDAHEVNGIYEIEKLNDEESLLLFSRKAFKQDQPPEGYQELCKHIVSYAAGLPLVLQVMGSTLYPAKKNEWQSAIGRLTEIAGREVLGILQRSFDGLDDSEKEIFLDIACFLKGMDKDRATNILNSCGLPAEYGIETLIGKYLVTVSGNVLSMHDLLQVMGREIVRRKSPNDIGGRSRLWAYEDVFAVLKDDKGEKVVSIHLDLPETEAKQCSMNAFSKMTKLRYLKIHNVQFARGPDYLSKQLRFLEWHAYPSESLPSCFEPDNLVELDMSYSSVQKLWHENKSLVNLRIINLSHSQSLTKTPDFSTIPNLERLILEGCTSLLEVDASIRHHKKLVYVNLIDCKSLTSLPNNLEMESLKVLTLCGCSKLKKFPDIGGSMEYLKKLYLDGTGIEELPFSIHHFAGLVLLSLNSCENLQNLPSSISGLKSLKRLFLSGCCRLRNLPENLSNVECLKVIDLRGTAIRKPLASIFEMKNLKELHFDGHGRLGVVPVDLVLPSFSALCSLKILNLSACNLGEGAVPSDLGCLSLLRKLDLSRNNFVSLPASICQLSRLEVLSLEDCRMLQSLPEVPFNIQDVNFNGCKFLKEIPDPIKLCSPAKTEFKCLNCWNMSNSQDSIGFTLLTRYLQGSSNPRPRFSIAIPGSKIPVWFSTHSGESSISVQVPSNWHSKESEWMGIAACVAFSASSSEDHGSSLFCHFKTNGGKSDPLTMCISWNHSLPDHIWLFFLSFGYFKEWHHQCLNSIELSFLPNCQSVEVKNCGIRLVSSSLFASHYSSVSSSSVSSSMASPSSEAPSIPLSASAASPPPPSPHYGMTGDNLTKDFSSLHGLSIKDSIAALPISPEVKNEDRPQKSLDKKQQENEELLVKCISQDLGFSGGSPVAACLIYRCLLEWRVFETKRTRIFDLIIETISSAVEDNNAVLPYWLSNSCILLLLLLCMLEASGGLNESTLGERLVKRRTQGFQSLLRQVPATRQVEAKHPALLFQQQLTTLLGKIYRMIRDNMKKEISPLLGLCIQAPRTSRASLVKGRSQANAIAQQALVAHWQSIVKSLNNCLKIMRANYVPSFLVQKVFTQIFSFINVQLFNSLLLRRECCSLANGEYVRAGLAELEQWCRDAMEFAGTSWDELKHIRQAVGFLVIHQKPKKTLKEITNDLCPVLSIQQLYRISTMYWDDKYGTHSVSSEVISSMRVMMTEESNNAVSTSFLLDDDSSIPFSVDDISKSMQQIEVGEIDPPPLIRENSGFSFLLQRAE